MQDSVGIWRSTAALALLLVVMFGCGKSPQLEGNADALKAADALWTAVTAQQIALLDRSTGEIGELHADGKMSDEAFDALSKIAATARSGAWPDARAQLKTLIRAQRPAPR